ncbi:hypothetical protein PanWU01x14_012880, partial [Parasponia andersonii]
ECPKEEIIDLSGQLVSNCFGDWLKAFNLRQWRNELRERKSGGHWSDSNISSSGKSSGNSDEVNNNSSDVYDLGLNSDEETTHVTVMEAQEKKIFHLNNTSDTSKLTEKSTPRMV